MKGHYRGGIAFVLYDVAEPIDLRLPAAEQARLFLAHARTAHCNEPFAALFGCTPAELIGEGPHSQYDRIPAVDREALLVLVAKRLEQLAACGYRLCMPGSIWSTRGRLDNVEITFEGGLRDGRLTHLELLISDGEARRHRESLVFSIADSLAVEQPGQFFERLVQRLAETLGIDFAFCGIYLSAPEPSIRTLAGYKRGEPFGEIVYRLAGTPCADAMARRVFCHPSGVAARFPEDQLLIEWGVDAYLGVPLFAADGTPLGLLSLMHSLPFPDLELARSLLTIFAMRAVAELERMKQETRRNLLERRRALFFEQNPSGMFVLDVEPPLPVALPVPKQVQWLLGNSRLVEYNAALMAMLGGVERGERLVAVLEKGNLLTDMAGIARRFIDEGYRLQEHVASVGTSAAAKPLWLSWLASGHIVDGHVHQIIGLLTDVTARVTYTAEMEYRARHDALTGLPNRGCLQEELETVLSVGDRAALYLLDLDGFKEVNDTLGHDVGDALLREIGPRLQRVMGERHGLIARLGGDEFAVLWERCDEAAVAAFAAELVRTVRQPFRVGELELLIGGSLGIALAPDSGQSAGELMRCADVAMYQAKASGLGYQLYLAEQDHHSLRRLSLMMDLRSAVEQDQLVLHYQPILSLADERLLGFEALLRWQHPQHGLLPPGEFIPLIELTDILEPMTWWVVEQALAQLAKWRELPYRIAVNISTRNIAHAQFAERMEGLLRRYDVPGSRLELEITESTLMADPEQARRTLQALAAKGIHLSIDDYGTGYSSLAYLKSLPIDTLKIDRTFIAQMLENSHDRIIVHSTIQLAHNLGLTVTAEGLENEAVMAVLKALGCDKAQGYHICRPVALAQLESWMAARHAVAGAR